MELVEVGGLREIVRWCLLVSGNLKFSVIMLT